MIKQRVIQLIDYKGVKKEAFFKKINISSANFRGKAKETPLNSTAIENIFTVFPDINLEWLLTGKGAMICEPAQKPAIIEDLEKELQGLKDKYYKLMEENHDLLVELRALESKNSKPQKAS